MTAYSITFQVAADSRHRPIYNSAGDSRGGGCLKFCPEHSRGATAAVFLPFLLSRFWRGRPNFGRSRPRPVSADEQADKDRILGVIPNYLAVEDPSQKVPPLTAKQKYLLFAKETFDPFTVASAAVGAALSQLHNDDPKYGKGSGPYAQRFGAAVADITTQNFFQDAVLASILHEDPRYFRRGPEFGVWYRVGYALSRVLVTRTDAGKQPLQLFRRIGNEHGYRVVERLLSRPQRERQRSRLSVWNQHGRLLSCQSSAGILARCSSEVFPSQAAHP